MALLSDIHTECRSEWMKRVLENGNYKKTHTFYFRKMGITEAGVGIVHTQHTQTHTNCATILISNSLNMFLFFLSLLPYF